MKFRHVIHLAGIRQISCILDHVGLSLFPLSPFDAYFAIDYNLLNYLVYSGTLPLGLPRTLAKLRAAFISATNRLCLTLAPWPALWNHTTLNVYALPVGLKYKRSNISDNITSCWAVVLPSFILRCTIAFHMSIVGGLWIIWSSRLISPFITRVMLIEFAPRRCQGEIIHTIMTTTLHVFHYF